MRESWAIRLFMVLAGVLMLGQASLAAPIDPCSLVSKAEAGALLGSPILHASAFTPVKDEETGGMQVNCMMSTKTSGFVISVVSFSSAGEAHAKTTKEVVAERNDGNHLKIEEVKGLGDRAYWATTDNGAQYVVVKGARVLGLSLGGQLAHPPASYQSGMRALVVKALAKL